MLSIGAILVHLSLISTSVSLAEAGSTVTASTFTYQGRLDQDGAPIEGVVDLEFRLFNDAAAGNQVGPTVELDATSVHEGLFTVALDFGVAALDGTARWLEITVDGVTLAPRQAITSVPYAIQTRGLFVNDAGNVGVGKTNPAVRLDVSGSARAGQFELASAAVRLHSDPQSQLISGWDPNANANAAGAFLESTITSGSPGGLYLDANVAAIWNNGVDMLRLYNSATLPAGAPRFVIDADGRIGIGNADPIWTLDTSATQSVARLVSTNAAFGSVIILRNSTPLAQTQALGAINIENNAGVGVGQLLYLENGAGTANDFIRLTVGQNAIADLGASAIALFRTTSVQAANFQPLTVIRTGSDGTLVSFVRDAVEIGSISSLGAFVSYNAFTGSHFAWTDEELGFGELVRMTGLSRRFHGQPDAEILHGVERTGQANDPACMGAYLGVHESTRPPGDDNPHLIMAEGNGALWVVDTGADIEAGDGLISSDEPGCAMLDDAERFPVGHIVARAAERVDWSALRAAGVRRTRIAVLFAPAVRDSRGAVAETQVASVERSLEDLRQENERLTDAVATLAAQMRAQQAELDAIKARLAAPADMGGRR